MSIIVMEYENPDVAAVRRKHQENRALALKTEQPDERRAREYDEAEEYRRAAIRRSGPRSKYYKSYANTSDRVKEYKEEHVDSYGGLTNTRVIAEFKNNISKLQMENDRLMAEVERERRKEIDAKLERRKLEHEKRVVEYWGALSDHTMDIDHVLTKKFANTFHQDMQSLSISGAEDKEDREWNLPSIPQVVSEPVEIVGFGYDPRLTKEQHFNRIIASPDFETWVNSHGSKRVSGHAIQAFVEQTLKHEEREFASRENRRSRLDVDHRTGKITHRHVPALRPGADFDW